ncbi:hypothetical protein B0T21DRAFT_412366 [Apiosordaria backusii]|uniref:Uncharacterized protein n=1 Tax=Apiosordaria backusii TaxID=314023 RepID=A0AA40EDB3_9PEZI|nr:hypothetical protein B0T21DRAFT_412366 [Apiosordaria backusii]
MDSLYFDIFNEDTNDSPTSLEELGLESYDGIEHHLCFSCRTQKPTRLCQACHETALRAKNAGRPFKSSLEVAALGPRDTPCQGSEREAEPLQCLGLRRLPFKGNLRSSQPRPALDSDQISELELDPGQESGPEHDQEEGQEEDAQNWEDEEGEEPEAEEWEEPEEEEEEEPEQEQEPELQQEPQREPQEQVPQQSPELDPEPIPIIVTLTPIHPNTMLQVWVCLTRPQQNTKTSPPTSSPIWTTADISRNPNILVYQADIMGQYYGKRP